MITVIDYGAGNLKSVEKALNFLGAKNEITSDPEKIENAEKLILPGVGSFGAAMENLKSSGIDAAIKKRFPQCRFWAYALDFSLCLNTAKKAIAAAWEY